MTLIIAGYDYKRPYVFSSMNEELEDIKPLKMELDGIFVMADSAITTHKGGRTLLNGFKKVHIIKGQLWKPYFLPDGSFKDYFEVHESRNFLVAFAGSTLTAQHIINSVTEHLSNLRISYERHNNGSITYKAIRHCQKNPLVSDGISYWDDDTFLDRNFEGLLTGEIIAKTTEYSINEALKSAGKYKLTIDEFREMHTELVLGVYCPYKKRHELYVYRMLDKPGADGVLIAYTEAHLVEEKKLILLGMRKDFEENAQQDFDISLQEFRSPSSSMYTFLKNAIDKVQNLGSKEIDHPTSFRKLCENSIERIE